MRVQRLIVAILLAVTVPAACNRFVVDSNYDRSAKFTSLRTYAWRPGPQPRTGLPHSQAILLDQTVRTAIVRVLAKKGFHPAAEDAKPDFLVDYFVALRENPRVQSSDRGNEDNWIGTPLNPNAYDQGTLQIDIYTGTTSKPKLMWRGAGVAVVDPSASVDTRKKRINAAVAQILSKFPPNVGVSLS